MSRLRAIATVVALALLLAVPALPAASARPIVPDLCASFACLHPAVANVSVTFTNAQAIATGTFDEQWVLPSSTYAAYLNANVTNFYLDYLNGTLIPTWVETNATNASATTIVWSRLFNIPATSSVTVFVNIAAESPLMAGNGPVGEAPQLTATYGAFDDGFKVFDHYWNWSGTTNPTGWTHSASVTVTVNNGVTLTSTAAGQTYVSPFTLAKGSGWGDRCGGR